MHRRHLLPLVLLAGLLGVVFVAPSGWRPLPAVRPGGAPAAEVRQVILLIPDGCSQSMVTLARWMRGAPLALDRIQTGAVRTHSADSLVTDSAAAATALACGVKTANGTVGAAPLMEPFEPPSDPACTPGQPLASVLEGAKRSGRAVGMVVTSSVGDATPAAFAAHIASRGSADTILEQLVYQDLDVVFGGGRDQLLPATHGGLRADNRDLLAELQARGAQVVADADAMEQVGTGRVWGIFAPGNLAADMDRAAVAPEQPSLARMTAKAIELLRHNPRGFFLLVEGSQVDKACHGNDPAKAVREFLAFDDAVAEALAFADGEGRGETLVIACPDDDTGGLSIGRRDRTPRYPADLTAPLAGMQISAELLADRIGDDRSAENLAAHLDAWWHLRPRPDELAEITNRLAAGAPLAATLAEVVSRGHTAVGWISNNHTGVDVPLWSHGPYRLNGVLDNTEIARTIAQAMRLDLPALTRELFVDARAAFPEAHLDTADAATPALAIGTARLPLNQNRLLRDGRALRLDGLVVHMETTGRTYIPRQAVELCRGGTGTDGRRGRATPP